MLNNSTEKNIQDRPQSVFVTSLILAIFLAFFVVSFFLPESNEDRCVRIITNIFHLESEKLGVSVLHTASEELDSASPRMQEVDSELKRLSAEFDMHCALYKKYVEAGIERSKQKYSDPPGINLPGLNLSSNSVFEESQEEDLWERYNAERKNRQPTCADLRRDRLVLVEAHSQVVDEWWSAGSDADARLAVTQKIEEIRAELERVREDYDACGVR